MILLTFLLTSTLAGPPAATPGSEPSVHERLLLQHGIAANAESLKQYFASLQPTKEQERRVAALVKQLSDDDFARREEASKQLLSLPVVAQRQLQLAIAGGDPEVRWRAQQILKNAEKHSAELLNAVLTVISRRKVRGLASSLLDSSVLIRSPQLTRSFRAAMKATSTKADMPKLEQALDNARSLVRMSAIVGLDAADRSAASEAILRMTGDEDDEVRLTAARIVADQGGRESLTVLIDLLDSDSITIRARANQVLRALTDEEFGFVSYAEAKQRASAVKAWRDWHVAHAATAKLRFPLREQQLYIGRFLLCNYSSNVVTEYDQNRKEIWKREGFNHPWGVQGLPNGNRLVASCNGKYAVEIDSAGREVWKKDGLPGHPLSIQRLENGNTLVSCGNAGVALEIAPDGTIAREVTVGGFVADAQRLPNGRTLIARYNVGEVVEVDAENTIVWKVDGLKSTRSAQRLENGNTLVTSNGDGRVVEFDPAGRIVWFIDGLSSPYDSKRLPDGRTLISDSAGLRLVDHGKKVIWQMKVGSAGRIAFY